MHFAALKHTETAPTKTPKARVIQATVAWKKATDDYTKACEEFQDWHSERGLAYREMCIVLRSRSSGLGAVAGGGFAIFGFAWTNRSVHVFSPVVPKGRLPPAWPSPQSATCVKATFTRRNTFPRQVCLEVGLN